MAALAIPRFVGTQENAKEQTHQANIRTIESALSLYAAEKGHYTTNIKDLVTSGYLKEEPKYPKGEGKAYYIANSRNMYTVDIKQVNPIIKLTYV